MEKLRVLIADDNGDVRWAMIRLLKVEFDVVGATADGQSLIDAALTLQPDVIVSDISMPFLTGPEAMDVLKVTGLSIPFVLVSADSSAVEDYIEVGALGFVHKLDLADELASAIPAAARGEVYVSRAALREVAAQCRSLRP
jgi:DNA-binding NarL/FixJ family response regulator